MDKGSTTNPNNSFKDIVEDKGVSPNKFQVDLYTEQVSVITSGPTFDDTTSFDKLRKYSKIVKWFSAILSLSYFLYLIPGAWPLVFTFAFPVVGFVGAHKFNDCLNKFYLCYLALIILVQVTAMVLLRNTIFIALQPFVLLLEIILIIFEVKLLKAVSLLSDSDYNKLRNT